MQTHAPKVGDTVRLRDFFSGEVGEVLQVDKSLDPARLKIELRDIEFRGSPQLITTRADEVEVISG